MGGQMPRFEFACRLRATNVPPAMNIRLPLALFAALLLAGCGKKENVPATVAAATGSAPAASAPSATASAATPTTTGTPAATAATPAPTAAKSGGARVIEITANDQMKFSLATIEAKAGEELKVVLTNVGTLPKEAMGHNWVLLKAGTDPMAFGMASMTAKDNNYIAPAMKDQVVAFIPILGPKQSGDTTFKAPAAGEYPFICSFPGHVALMKGTLTVK
jgi:azurin